MRSASNCKPAGSADFVTKFSSWLSRLVFYATLRDESREFAPHPPSLLKKISVISSYDQDKHRRRLAPFKHLHTSSMPHNPCNRIADNCPLPQVPTSHSSDHEENSSARCCGT
ncbi:hypothetical protein SISNIDRAFT_343180 [Sistotremastrum niveocremeum HHB9708]|uniref:Uncharacterized protein n=1 Tax=Sistotremastrum niveocremeum HHB9708 TaxID=1314777 RepID=A0A164MLJ6_9AGAM|nr:hypothetical protein SISNIDRAFT_343180 [Sistotremastrum niveocremeum HHB9708]